MEQDDTTKNGHVMKMMDETPTTHTNDNDSSNNNNDDAATTSSSSSSSSRVLTTILSHAQPEPQSLDTFWNVVWQKACAIYPDKERCPRNTKSTQPPPPPPPQPFLVWDAQAHPLTHLIDHGWTVLLDLLEAVRPTPLPRGVDRPLDHHHNDDDIDIDDNNNGRVRPLLFRNLSVLGPDERAMYNDHNVWAAFLDGCSIVINHADHVSPWLAAICDDLQAPQPVGGAVAGFPHAYANTYLTPPGAQTAPPHADDRDVLVIQVVGRKEWIVHGNIPVPLPYPHEQVGKDGMKVPEAVLEGPILLQRILEPGDVLYMPRGYVHQARATTTTTTTEPSFHVTIALATHDWTLAGILGHKLIPQILQRQIEYRRAIWPLAATTDNNDSASSSSSSLQTTIDTALEHIRQQVTAQVVQDHLQQTFAMHNQRAGRIRQALYQKYSRTTTTTTTTTTTSNATVGLPAARKLQFTTRIRAATLDERESCRSATAQNKVGLHVREDVANAVTQILTFLKEQPNTSICIQDLAQECFLSDIPPTLCPLTIMAFCKQCVELGALAVDVPSNNDMEE